MTAHPPAIPILNLYYLLAYAWDCLEAQERPAAASHDGDGPDAAGHLASVLVAAVARLFRQGFPRGYVERSEDASRVSGRVDMGESLRRLLLRQAKAHCRHDEFAADIPPNRILRATLEWIARSGESVSGDTRRQAGRLLDRFPEVRREPLNAAMFRTLSMNRHWKDARLALTLCLLLARRFTGDERLGRGLLPDYRRDERRMAVLFERFVHNFYRREAKGFFRSIGRQRIPWDLADDAESREAASRLLPGMETDVSLVSETSHVVVECKYCSHILAGRSFGGDGTEGRLRGDHFRQIYAYLANLRRQNPGRRLSGLLLYAQSEPFEPGTIALRDGVSVTVAPLDLYRRWPDIRRDLLRWVGLPARSIDAYSGALSPKP